MSEQPKHTPGDWHAEYSAGVVGYAEWLVIRDGCKHAIAQDILDPETGLPSEANARLISAAPELLEALKDMLSGWRYIRQDPAHRNIYGVGWDRAQEKAEAAIAKAEGRGE
jgi:hypothetical protein